MNKSDTISELAKALATFQGKMTAVKKDATNPFYKSKYATLDTIWETIRKPLSENGLSVAQTMNLTPSSESVLETTLYHTSGEWISGTQLVSPVKDDPQSLGSAISYARRYSLSAILGIVADEDDDGNAATTKLVTKPETTPSKSPTPIVKAPESQKEAPKKENKGNDTTNLLTWVAEGMNFRNNDTAKVWLIKSCGITEERINSEPLVVRKEIAELQNWSM